MLITEIAEDVTELATRITVALPERLHAIRAEMAGQPRAARYDTGGVSHQWCWTHERDVDQCQREDLDCTGETFVLHDPTGEAATLAAMGADPASRDRRDLERHLRAAQRVLNQATDIMARYSPARPDIPRAGIGTCTDCHRYFDGTTATGSPSTRAPIRCVPPAAPDRATASPNNPRNASIFAFADKQAATRAPVDRRRGRTPDEFRTICMNPACLGKAVAA
jgi:hypothetical protein